MHPAAPHHCHHSCCDVCCSYASIRASEHQSSRKRSLLTTVDHTRLLAACRFMELELKVGSVVARMYGYKDGCTVMGLTK